MSGAQQFDYEKAIWGAETLRPGEWSIAGYRLDEMLLHLPSRGRVLEVGCGAGRFLRAIRLQRPELELVGADVSQSALAILSGTSPEIETRCVEGASLARGRRASSTRSSRWTCWSTWPTPDRCSPRSTACSRREASFTCTCPARAIPAASGAGSPDRAGSEASSGASEDTSSRFAAARSSSPSGLAASRRFACATAFTSSATWPTWRCSSDSPSRNRRRPAGEQTTTGDVIARKSPVLRLVDALLYWEARLLGRVPSWSLHVSARRR